MVTVVLPAQLKRLANIDGEVRFDLPAPVTQRALLDALEARYPALLGTTRDRRTKRRRAYIRFFACNEDWSDAAPDDALPDAVASGKEPFIVIGAMSGG
ncbi:MAG TPA: MoaD/ThiS family protein [Woeseiaceae bacterium]|nr:MoaD/ThiS family protein [Woeseiaceae bacterium]